MKRSETATRAGGRTTEVHRRPLGARLRGAGDHRVSPSRSGAGCSRVA